ncbi:ABC transporter permease [Apilactobacillus timberlakei]|uniref:ABC transporter permease n=1 Tax=Apilactobacillus timberlakei TaxID=2008380 RepID=A0ABY2YTA6_9LACO|nr:ABC transporter permease [Apilactobacillus timberlakei]TPR14169.1 ABC transporter permease [Apilactobacillus timberlakei]TPR16422.1 ABC transporter permease [Apilactobacillus timberlakei]
MISLIKRNLMLYFNNRQRVFFSLMGAIISFILYVLFLKNGIQSDWKSIHEGTKLLDLWLIGGTMTVTAITTTQSALNQKIMDKENNRIDDLMLTDTSKLGINAGYVFSSVIIGTIMQVAVYIIMSFYFLFSDNLSINYEKLIAIILIAILSSFIWTMVNMIINLFFDNQASISGVNSIVGTCSGFFAGVYMPLGTLPNAGQKIMEFIPASYNSALYRNLLMKHQMNISFKNVPAKFLTSFNKNMGLKINDVSTIMGHTIILLVFIVILICIFSLISLLKRRRA